MANNVASVRIESHIEEVNEEMLAKVEEWLEGVGEDAAGTAAGIPNFPVDSGRLKNSINWATAEAHGGGDSPLETPEEKAVYIGTNVEYAVYHEFGSGKYAENGSQAKRIPWAFKDKNGNWHLTSGVPARHFLQFGMTAHKEQYKQMLEDKLKQ